MPILLTPSDQLNASTAAFVQANGIAEVVVLGGQAAVQDATVASLPGVRRVAGSDRTATAAAIANELWAAGGWAQGGVVLVNVRAETGWQTALAASVISAVTNSPQLGVENPPAAPTQATLAAATAIGGPVEVYGSPDLVSAEQLAAVQAA